MAAAAVLTTSASAVAGAGFTTVDESVDGTGHCKNGNPAVNCNIYDGKQFVWLNGGPSANGLSPDGEYFFAVLSPGGQADPNDGTAKNLSDDFDTHTDRTFTVSGGEVSVYGGPHGLDSGSGALNTPDGNPPFIRLAPYADTTNPGGVYIMAICYIGDGSGYPVDPRDCKYDAFKVVAAGVTPPASDLTAIKDATPEFTRTYTWGISKESNKDEIDSSDGSGTFSYTVNVTHDDGTDSGWKVTGTITVFNLNNFDVNGVDVSDAIHNGTVPSDPADAGSSCLVTGGTDATITKMASSDFAYTCTYSQAPAAADELNVADITWPDNGDLSAGSTQATFAFTWGDPTTIKDGEVTVSDPDAPNPPLPANVKYTDASPTPFTYDITWGPVDPGTCDTFTNKASFATLDTHLDNLDVSVPDQTGDASKTVTVCAGADLTVTKTATPAFKRTYVWDISKDVDKTKVQQIGGTATFNYTIKAHHDAGTNSDWVVNGSITVSNPNDWESITTDITDAIDNGGVCTVTNGTSVTIAASGSETRDYQCTYSSAPSPSDGTNTATATWLASAASTPNGSATGTADAKFSTTTPSSIDECVAVTDTFAGSLGNACVGDANPKSFTYSRTISVPAHGCLSYDNTATFTTNDTGTTGSASKTVTVCGPANTGALTIGFWKNSNGQSLIKTYCQSGALGTYLRGLGAGAGPFSNAPNANAPTTCPLLATYVQGIISGSSATNMNVMLKAQMLATALDVWFSGPGWTATKIGSVKPPSNFLMHNSLGGFNMDTTAICPMVDNTIAGSGTCKNNKPSTNAVLSGAVPSSPMTMQAILDFASTTPVPFNGSTSNGIWYGGDRTKQEILKNIFDQFNNGDAFAF